MAVLKIFRNPSSDMMEFLDDGSVIYDPVEHEKAQRALACVHELQDQYGKSTQVDKVTSFNTKEAAVEGGK